jgi:hypothetical protein
VLEVGDLPGESPGGIQSALLPDGAKHFGVVQPMSMPSALPSSAFASEMIMLCQSLHCQPQRQTWTAPWLGVDSWHSQPSAVQWLTKAVSRTYG